MNCRDRRSSLIIFQKLYRLANNRLSVLFLQQRSQNRLYVILDTSFQEKSSITWAYLHRPSCFKSNEVTAKGGEKLVTWKINIKPILNKHQGSCDFTLIWANYTVLCEHYILKNDKHTIEYTWCHRSQVLDTVSRRAGQLFVNFSSWFPHLLCRLS